MLQRSIRPFLSNSHSRSTTYSSLYHRLYSMSSHSGLPKITLTRNEQELADLLVGCADWVDQNPQLVDKLRLKDELTGEWIGKLRGQEPVELRIAGGWVRDKLLGKESDDIDISTSPDPITGLKFATLFEQYLETLGKRQQLMGKLTKIEAKPEQSKHLETATARVCQLSIDWVQQRGQEVYSEGSRIPTVSFGTPLEDAERRDLTINALFYNLRTREIEDQTGKGLSDLGILEGSKPRIRTPLEPFKTFKDDPLRIVRAVRFAARFGRQFELDREMVTAIEQEEIRKALLDPKKISRERVGAELEKMLLGKDPQYAFELIESLNLHPLIFLYDHSNTFTNTTTGTSTDPPPLSNTFLSVTASNVLTSLVSPSSTLFSSLHPLLRLQVINPPPLPPHQPLPPYPEPTTPILSCPIYPQTLKRLYLSCGLLPLYDLSTLEKNKVVWIGEKVIREGIKGPLVDISFCKKLREGFEILSKEINNHNHTKFEEEEDQGEDRVRIGMLLRNPSVHDGQHMKWNVSLFWSLIVDLVRSNQKDSELQFKLINNYNSFVSKIQSLELDTLAFSPPLLDGKSINTLLPFTKSSPAMVQILQSVIAQQLRYPDWNREQIQNWLMSEQVVQEIREMCEKIKRDRASGGGGGVKRKGGGGERS
ncbi:hypothetical protein JCM5350_006717 [Sporobolomyces pararoseus]